MNRMTVKIDPLTLSNIVDGELEEKFQDMLAEVARIFEIPDDGRIPWALSGGEAKCKMTLEIDFSHHFERRMTSVSVSTKLKTPNLKAASRPVMVRDGGVFCEPGGDQLDLIEYAGNQETK